MTKERICASDTGLPELAEHISEMQVIACRLTCLLELAADVDNNGTHEGGITALLEVMCDMGGKLYDGLDSITLPKVSL